MTESQTINQRLKKAISLAFKSGYQIDKEAFTFLKMLAQKKELEKIMETTLDSLNSLSKKPLFITKEIIETNIINKFQKKESNDFGLKEGVGEEFNPLSKDFFSEIEVLVDPSENIGSKGSLNDFLQYFQDRYKRIEKLLKERLDTKDTISIKQALNSPSNKKVKVIGIVTEIRERKGTVFIQLEDFEVNVTILVSSRAKKVIRDKAQRLLLDQIICVEGIVRNNDLIIATDFINPDIPERKPTTAKIMVYAALLSDLHIGSKQFQNKAFNKFIKWLNGHEGNYRQRQIASRVKYVIIAGDLVDGVGIYPNQKKELVISDIYEQYSLAANKLQQIPEHIDLIIIPGNHDATRHALPQQAIPREYAEPIYEAREAVMLGNPSKIRLNGVEFLLYHGRSLDDVISSVPDLMYKNIETTISKAMKYLLKVRHLAPIYGGKTPIAPDPQDALVIDSVPDVFHAGHVHVLGYEQYRGTLIVNSGCWQSQTAFQKQMGLRPIWGIVPILNLKTLKITPMDFTQEL